MDVTPRDLSVLRFLALFFVATTSQIHRRCFGGNDVSVARRRLCKLHAVKLVNKMRSEVVVPPGGLTGPVYYPSRLGCQTLALHSWKSCGSSARSRPRGRVPG